MLAQGRAWWGVGRRRGCGRVQGQVREVGGEGEGGRDSSGNDSSLTLPLPGCFQDDIRPLGREIKASGLKGAVESLVS